MSASEKIGRYSAISTNATKHAHEDHDGRLDQRQRRGHLRVDVLFVKFGHAVQHRPAARRWIRRLRSCRSPAPGKISVVLSDPESGCPSRTHLAGCSRRRASSSGVPANPAAVSMRLHQRNAAGQQRAQNARKLRHLILQPDLADDRHAAASRGRCVSRADFAPRPPAEQRRSPPISAAGKHQDVVARRGADRDQEHASSAAASPACCCRARRSSAPRRSPGTPSGRSPARSARTGYISETSTFFRTASASF